MKKIAYIYRLLICSIAFSAALLTFQSCEDYLDKAPEAGIDENAAFKDFKSFQGFVEELYSCVIEPMRSPSVGSPNFGDDMLCSVTTNVFLASMDAGDYWKWNSTQANAFLTDAYGIKVGTKTFNQMGLWPNYWYGIRKANLGLANLDKLVNATEEEKNTIKGQLLYFRGYFYHEIMKWWGGMPYIDRLLEPDENMNLPRLNYRETALKADKDLSDAANLLPVSWDNSQVGLLTKGNNRFRVSAATALAYEGKNLLYAASPMMNKESTGNNSYDAELCKQAAKAFAQVINLCEGANAPYSLQSWSTYKDIFYKVSSQRTINGGVEGMDISPMYDYSQSIWGVITGNGQLVYATRNWAPTANYVKNFGMANGLPITDPASGYNPADPWMNRDPRFYKVIVVDGDMMSKYTANGVDQYAQLYNGGRHRDNNTSSITGYMTNKNWGPEVTRLSGINIQYQSSSVLMRLSDVYLMYAEAVLHGYGSATSSYPGSITAEEAINRVRNRATLPSIDQKFTTSKEAFMGEIMRERAVELCFEGHRFHDLRRWGLAGLQQYKEKTVLDFDRASNGKPTNIRERVLVTRVFEDKHNWLPLPVNQVTLNTEFKQNPGW